MNARFRHAQTEEAEDLTRLAMRSKQSWGYDDDFMRRVASDMRVSGADISSGHCIVAESEGCIVAYLLIRMAGNEAFLRDLFVDPPHFGRGLGRALFEEALRYARANGAVRLTLDSDPYAQAFYERFGMRCTGRVASIVGNGRTLPVMTLDLA